VSKIKGKMFRTLLSERNKRNTPAKMFRMFRIVFNKNNDVSDVSDVSLLPGDGEGPDPDDYTFHLDDDYPAMPEFLVRRQ
jgi:hypothetical protein